MARTKRDAKRQFPAAIRRTRCKQAGEIGARRHQHQQSQPCHTVEKSANDVTVVREEPGPDQPQRHSGIRLWILLRQLSRDRTQFFLRLWGPHAWLQSAKHWQLRRWPVFQE